ncbi:hypothetical protein NLM27_21610 [Bradyrhizobium sp. CCGB12]|uniref:hypothetical protein n=1 Tax=Bradyrhizobium sp. CCGB12 TaxID=2949632 RepID=UPI0020B1E6C9|nr:hypothetical protein [Bradyrhizobium sp. CCGB12]MCP3391387.1 hypothetical protein [Bradyrhizobium sp. CCGB12]
MPKFKWRSRGKFRCCAHFNSTGHCEAQGRRYFTEQVRAWSIEKQRLEPEEAPLSRTNAIAIPVIVLVLVSGAAALYRLDTGEGSRSSRADSARTALD